LQRIYRNTGVDRTGVEATVLVVDNGSAEDIAGLLHEEFQEPPFPTYYRRNPINLGVAVAWNQILRFSPEPVPAPGFFYDYYVIANNDALVGPDWLQPMIEAMEADPQIGWISALENGSPLLDELVEAHRRSKQHRVDPSRPFTTEAIEESISQIYAEWDGHDAFCDRVRRRGLAAFVPFRQEGRSAVLFMVRPAMVEQIGFFDEDFAPVGIAEDLEYFLRIEQVLRPAWLTEERYPPEKRWKCGFSGRSVVHHNWCSTRQGRNFDGRKWDRERERHWKKKFGKSKKYFTKLLP
jgi:GT2 family glycosyltransferase